MNGDTTITGLTPVQPDGLACGVDYMRVRVPHVLVGRSVTNSQAFACAGCCMDDTRRVAGGALW